MRIERKKQLDGLLTEISIRPDHGTQCLTFLNHGDMSFTIVLRDKIAGEPVSMCLGELLGRDCWKELAEFFEKLEEEKA